MTLMVTFILKQAFSNFVVAGDIQLHEQILLFNAHVMVKTEATLYMHPFPSRKANARLVSFRFINQIPIGNSMSFNITFEIIQIMINMCWWHWKNTIANEPNWLCRLPHVSVLYLLKHVISCFLFRIQDLHAVISKYNSEFLGRLIIV